MPEPTKAVCQPGDSDPSTKLATNADNMVLEMKYKIKVQETINFELDFSNVTCTCSSK